MQLSPVKPKMLPTAQFGAAEAQDVGRSRHRWKLKLERSRESWKRGLAVSGPHPLTPTALVTVMRRDTFDRRSRWNACGHPVRAERPGGRAPSVKRTRATALVIRSGCHQGHRAAEKQAGNAFGLHPVGPAPACRLATADPALLVRDAQLGAATDQRDQQVASPGLHPHNDVW